MIGGKVADAALQQAHTATSVCRARIAVIVRTLTWSVQRSSRVLCVCLCVFTRALVFYGWAVGTGSWDNGLLLYSVQAAAVLSKVEGAHEV